MRRRRWRGSNTQPGLMLALERGGRCDGVAYRLPPGDPVDQLERLLRREVDYMEGLDFMRWLQVTDGDRRWRALGSWVGPKGEDVLLKQPLEDVAWTLARACGHIGSGAEYLHNTVYHLENFAIHDASLWRLQELVAQQIRSTHDI
jgi:cation transport protein ChaC